MKITACCFSVALAVLVAARVGASSPLDSARVLYEYGARHDDTASLRRAVGLLSGGGSADAALLNALCLWRLQFVAFIADDLSNVRSYGQRTLRALDKASGLGASPLQVGAYRALTYQLLASTGSKNGIVYGPRSGREIAALKKAYPDHFYTKLLEGLTLLEAPAIGGGNPQKSVPVLAELCTDHPDSSVAHIHLARAYLKTGRPQSAAASLDRALALNPHSRFALRVKRELDKRVR